MGFFKKEKCVRCGAIIKKKHKEEDGLICHNCYKIIPCDVCGISTPNVLLFTFPAGHVCEKCEKKTGLNIIEIQKKTLDEIKEAIGDTNENKGAFEQFNPTKVIGNKIQFDTQKGQWLLPAKGFGKKNKVPKVMNFEDILDFELLEDGENLIEAKGVGRALVGGALFGGVGAIVGGVTGGKNSKPMCNSLKVKIIVNDMENPNIYIDFIDHPTKKNGFIYKEKIKEVHELVSVLSIILEQNSVDYIEEEEVFDEPQLSIPDEILKYKELLDQGILTQEEFDKKKKELLNL